LYLGTPGVYSQLPEFYDPIDPNNTFKPPTMVHLDSDAPPAYEASSSGQNLSFGVSLHEGVGKSLLVTITPPREPVAQEKQPGRRAPLDLCLVIDVSGSMGTDAPAATEDGKSKESMGLSVLDVVKHACRTILSTMQDDDRLSIVTFTDSAEVRLLGHPSTTRRNASVRLSPNSARPRKRGRRPSSNRSRSFSLKI